jgi:ethanolamine utilization protein EutQ
MGNEPPRVRVFNSARLTTWMHDEQQDIQFGDLLDESAGARMDVTFIRWGAGEEGEFPDPLPYDEVFVVTHGSYGVRTSETEVIAHPGEVIYLRAGTSGVYFAGEAAEVVAITNPPYRKALREAGRGGDLELLHEVNLTDRE